MSGLSSSNPPSSPLDGPTLSLLSELSSLLNTGLDRQALASLVALIEQGVSPEALAAVVLELRKEAATNVGSAAGGAGGGNAN